MRGGGIAFGEGLGKNGNGNVLTTSNNVLDESWTIGLTTPQNQKTIYAGSRLDSGRWFSTAWMNN